MPMHMKSKQAGGDVWRERQEEGEVVVERIYVGDLQHHVTDQQLAHFFAQFGQVILFVCQFWTSACLYLAVYETRSMH